jgi:hypothetical protein
MLYSETIKRSATARKNVAKYTLEIRSEPIHGRLDFGRIGQVLWEPVWSLRSWP